MNPEIRLTTLHIQTISEKQAAALMLLGCSNAELQSYMEEEALSNPFAEMEYPEPEAQAGTERFEKRGDGVRETSYRGDFFETEPEDIESGTVSVWDVLGDQLPAAEITDREWNLVKMLAGYMDEDGYLRYDREELCRMTGAGKDAVKRAVALIQSLDPPGIGAYDLRECLLLQLASSGSGKDSPEIMIVSGYLEDLAANRAGKVARLLGISEKEVGAAFSKIRSLNPKPLNGLVGKPEHAVVPDMIFTADGHGCSLAMNDSWMGVLRKNAEYDNIDMTGLPPEDVKYIRERKKHLDNVMNGIEFRRKTVLAVVEYILLAQMEYVMNGAALLPVSMTDAAGKLGISVSTVSRAVRGKFIQTPRGILSARNLFALPAVRGGSVLSPDSLERLIREIIADENKKRPLSDQSIASILAERGFPAARRTVAKYRTRINIPCAADRKQHGMKGGKTRE